MPGEVAIAWVLCFLVDSMRLVVCDRVASASSDAAISIAGLESKEVVARACAVYAGLYLCAFLDSSIVV